MYNYRESSLKIQFIIVYPNQTIIIGTAKVGYGLVVKKCQLISDPSKHEAKNICK